MHRDDCAIGWRIRRKDQDVELNRDQWAVLQAKAEGEALLKASAVKDGEGLWAYVKMHQWFISTTDLGKTNQRVDIMRPPQCKHDWEVAEAVERWEEKYRIIKEEDGDQQLPEKYRMTALKCILVGDIKKHIELREEELKTYDEMRSIIMKWAVNKKIEKDKGHAPMDIGKVDEADE